MKRHQPLIFPITVVVDKIPYALKALKYAGPNLDMFYKVALPSALSDVPVCWFSKTAESCELIVGGINSTVSIALKLAIEEHELIPVISNYKDLTALKSA